MIRQIIHIDLDAFFCAVEEQHNPDLEGIPFAVGGKPQERGVVASCSYAARKYGIRSAMPMARALRLCPELVIISSNHSHYREVSNNIFDRLDQITTEIEQVSIDEAFLDVSDVPKSAERIAREIQLIIRDEFRLPCSLGVATNKLVAKIATDFGKSSHHSDTPPNAITVVKPGDEAEFLDPLPAEILWGVGPKTAVKLEELGIYTIGDIARWPPEDLINRFGRHGELISKFSRGMDDRPINKIHIVKSISRETTFSNDTNNNEVIENTLKELSDNVAQRLSNANLIGSTIKIKVRWSDFTTITRQLTLISSTDNAKEISQTAKKLLMEVWDRKKPIRLIGVGISNLKPPHKQLTLWDSGDDSGKLKEAIANLKNKFGEGIVKLGHEIPTDQYPSDKQSGVMDEYPQQTGKS